MDPASAQAVSAPENLHDFVMLGDVDSIIQCLRVGVSTDILYTAVLDCLRKDLDGYLATKTILQYMQAQGTDLSLFNTEELLNQALECSNVLILEILAPFLTWPRALRDGASLTYKLLLLPGPTQKLMKHLLLYSNAIETDMMKWSSQPLLVCMMDAIHASDETSKDASGESFRSLLKDTEPNDANKQINIDQTDVLSRNAAHIAALLGLDEFVEVMAELCPHLFDAMDVFGDAPCHIAALADNISAIKIMIANGINLWIPSNQGWTVLHMACRGGNAQLLEVLLGCLDGNAELQQQLTAASNDGSTPFHIAISHGHVDIVARILQYAREKCPTQLFVDMLLATTDAGCSGLHLSCMFGGISDIITQILQALHETHTIKQVIEMEDSEGCTPLHLAVQAGKAGAVRLLLRSDLTASLIDINKPGDKTGWTAAHFAAKSGVLSILQTLIEHDVNLSCRDKRGHTPFMLACVAGKLHAAKAIFCQVGNAALADITNDGNDALDVACSHTQNEITEWLLTDLRSRWPKDPVKRSTHPLHTAASRNNPAGCSILISAGFAPDECDEDGFTAVQHAANHGSTDCVRVLLDHGAQVDGGSQASPLVFAVQNKHISTVMLLAGYVEKDSLAAAMSLHMSVVDEEWKCAQILLLEGVDPNQVSPTGTTPFDEAILAGAHIQAGMLLRIGINLSNCQLVNSDDLLHEIATGTQATEVESDTLLGSASTESYPITPLMVACYNGVTAAARRLSLHVGAVTTQIDAYGGTALGWASMRGHKLLAAQLGTTVRVTTPWDNLSVLCMPPSTIVDDANYRSRKLLSAVTDACAAVRSDQAVVPAHSRILLLAAFHGYPTEALESILSLSEFAEGFAMRPDQRDASGASLVPFYDDLLLLEESIGMSPIEASESQGYPHVATAFGNITTRVARPSTLDPILAEAGAQIRGFLRAVEGPDMSFAWIPIPHFIPAALTLLQRLGSGAFGAVYTAEYAGLTNDTLQKDGVVVKLQQIPADARNRGRLWREIGVQLLNSYVRRTPFGEEAVRKTDITLLGFNVMPQTSDQSAQSLAILLRKRQGTLRDLLHAISKCGSWKSADVKAHSRLGNILPSGLPLRLALSLCTQLVRSLGQLHWREAPLVHGDLKSDNCLWAWIDGDADPISRGLLDGIVIPGLECGNADCLLSVELCDFGLASPEGEARFYRRYLRTLPPEVSSLKLPYTAKGDIFCIALILLEICLGGKWDNDKLAAIAKAEDKAAELLAESSSGYYVSVTEGKFDVIGLVASTASGADDGDSRLYVDMHLHNTPSTGSGLTNMQKLLDGSLPDDIAHLLMECISTDPEKRPMLNTVYERLVATAASLLHEDKHTLHADGLSLAGPCHAKDYDGYQSATRTALSCCDSSCSVVCLADLEPSFALASTLLAHVSRCHCDQGAATLEHVIRKLTGDSNEDPAASRGDNPYDRIAFDWLAVTQCCFRTSSKPFGYHILAHLLASDDGRTQPLAWKKSMYSVLLQEDRFIAEAAYALGQMMGPIAFMVHDELPAGLDGFIRKHVIPAMTDEGAAFSATQLLLGIMSAENLMTHRLVASALVDMALAIHTAVPTSSSIHDQIPWESFGPLMIIAAKERRSDALIELLNLGADPLPADSMGRTVLHHAAMLNSAGDIAILASVKELLDRADNGGNTALHRACLLRCIDSINALLDAGADPNIRVAGMSGKTALHLLCEQPSAEESDVSALLQHGAVVNVRDMLGNTPLHAAVSNGNVEIVRTLLRSGADGAARSKQGVTPREIAYQQSIQGVHDIFMLLR